MAGRPRSSRIFREESDESESAGGLIDSGGESGGSDILSDSSSGSESGGVGLRNKPWLRKELVRCERGGGREGTGGKRWMGGGGEW